MTQLAFFRLDTKALGLSRAKRRPATRSGWAVRWGTVRMFGTFLTEDPTAVPASVVRFVAEQLGIDDEQFAAYGACSQTAYEHAWEVRDEYGHPGTRTVPGDGRRLSAWCSRRWRRGSGR
ncbi:DUF4158 domain-containing protein [Streptomyces sp. NPDC101165]|uniref:DUF4158 domain-containing protein n=1 Tax=Streptomyces sp. NPDC101165 TaxID=3366119 RepID=UPI003801427C